MAERARRVATYDDLVAVPEHLVAELVGGDLITSPRPGPLHAVAASRMGGALGGPFDLGDGGGPGGWWIVDEPELHLGADVLVPDLAGWRRDRMPRVPETAWFDLAPDWVCEVLSPSTARLDRKDKLPRYAAAGIPFAWLVDPLARTLEVLVLDGSRWAIEAVHAGEEVVRARPFDAVPLALTLLWADPPPPPVP